MRGWDSQLSLNICVHFGRGLVSTDFLCVNTEESVEVVDYSGVLQLSTLNLD